ncbi:MarR family winged helix-turn-helix transcriptional regulator [Galactobacter valiniphilus]|uniref:MarR family winged helix-turn-helix transcriptional regulator n=1 Tax=Galactobacter valiniphilus TaxID=2676122 RepID=UPI003735518D
MAPRKADADSARGESASNLRVDASTLRNETFFVMARASALGSADANRALATLNLKVRQYSALALACSQEPPTQRELSEDLALDPSQIVAMVDALEERGLVQRHPDPRDRRSKIVIATAAGRELCTQARALVEQASASSLAALTEREAAELHRLLTKVALERG